MSSGKREEKKVKIEDKIKRIREQMICNQETRKITSPNNHSKKNKRSKDRSSGKD